MSLFDEYKTEHYDRLGHRILLSVGAFFIVGTTLLNIAFSYAPQEMIQLVRNLIA